MDEYGMKLAGLMKDHTVREMADILGCSERTVSRHMKKYGLTGTIGRTDIVDSDVLALWEDDFTIVEIARHFGCSHETITKRLLKYGIMCDRVTGIKKHFSRTHAELWPSIMFDLDSGMSVYAVSRKYHMRYDNVERLMKLNSYVR